MPGVRGDQETAGKGEVFEEHPCYQTLQEQTFGKIFSEGLILRLALQLLAATERRDIGKEKVLVFPEQSVFQIMLVYYREASKTLTWSSMLK